MKTPRQKAWDLFSKYIRLKYADSNGYEKCISCGKIKHYKEMQAGHWIAGRSNAILLEERGVYPQCYECNMGKQGNAAGYMEGMIDKFGEEEALRLYRELYRLSKSTKQMKKSDWEEKIEEYKQKLKDLEGRTDEQSIGEENR